MWRTDSLGRNLPTVVFPHACPSGSRVLCCCSRPGLWGAIWAVQRLLVDLGYPMDTQ